MTMWRRFFTPEILFLFGTLQALFPYVLWYFLGSNTNYHYEITYLPVVIWTVGYGFFWLGTKVTRIIRLAGRAKNFKTGFSGLLN